MPQSNNTPKLHSANTCTFFILLILLICTNPLWPVTDSTKTEEFIVKNLKVIFKRNTANETITVQLYLKGGVSNLTEENQGIEQFLFNCLTLTDRKYADKSWEKIFGGIGAQFGSFAAKDFTVVSLRCTRQYFDKMWEVFTDYVINSGFYDYRVEVTRDRMLAQIRQQKDLPDVYIRKLADEQFYEGHPYQLDPQGVEESISKITMKQMRTYLDKNLKKARSLLVVVGNVEKEDLTEKVAKTFGTLSKGKYKPEFPARVIHTSPKVKIVKRELPTNYILGLFSAPSHKEPDYYPMTIAINILKWRLFEEIRTKRNLSYAPDAFLANNFANYGSIYATSDHPDSTVKVMLAEMQKLRTEPVGEKDLRDQINMYLTRYYLNNETNSAQGQFLAQFEISGLGWQEGEKMVENLRNVTAADVQRVANKYFNNIQFVYLGNPELIEEKVFTTM